MPNVLRKQRQLSRPQLQNYLNEDDTFGMPPKQPLNRISALDHLRRKAGLPAKTPIKQEEEILRQDKRKTFVKKKSLQDAF